MCGIVGLLLKAPNLRDRLGEMLAPMLVCMNERGPDSAGFALFGEADANGAGAEVSSAEFEKRRRFSLFAPDAAFDWQAMASRFTHESAIPADVEVIDNNCVLTAAITRGDFARWLGGAFPQLHLLSTGKSIHMFKDVGAPDALVKKYRVSGMHGTHAIGHTRMATESAVSPAHAHPFTAGEDFCLVHNGSLSNPYSLRRRLERKGIRFETDNDTEAACRYLEWRMRDGDSLEEALGHAFEELDGFYTLLMATPNRMVLVRDPFACKPAVVAETDEYIAVSSEFRSLAHLPGIDSARLFEPRPETVYSWSV